jgi:oligoendopeptidase F
MSTARPPQSEFPRQFVASDADFGQWAAAEPYFQQLLDRDVTTAGELERWLHDASELTACLEEEGTRRYTAMTCQTDDADRRAAYEHYITQIEPQAEPWQDKLRRRFVDLAGKIDLPAGQYEVLERKSRNAIELFREENVPLQAEDKQLRSEYQSTVGAMAVEYDGREQTLQQMGRYLEEPDRGVRETAWRLVADRFQQDAEQLDRLYEKMVALRHKIARNAGLPDYRAYMFRALERFDYTPDDCRAFHDAIEQVCVPAAGRLADTRRSQLGVDSLRAWDMAVDPEGRPPLTSVRDRRRARRRLQPDLPRGRPRSRPGLRHAPRAPRARARESQGQSPRRLPGHVRRAAHAVHLHERRRHRRRRPHATA